MDAVSLYECESIHVNAEHLFACESVRTVERVIVEIQDLFLWTRMLVSKSKHSSDGACSRVRECAFVDVRELVRSTICI